MNPIVMVGLTGFPDVEGIETGVPAAEAEAPGLTGFPDVEGIETLTEPLDAVFKLSDRLP